jgi:hypothetical protein
MRLGRYFVGALVLAVLVVIFEGNFFQRRPALAVVLFGAYVSLVVYGGFLKYRQRV